MQSNKIRVGMKTSALRQSDGIRNAVDHSRQLSSSLCCFVVLQNETENKNDENVFSHTQPDFMQSLPVVSFQNKVPTSCVNGAVKSSC